LTAQFSALTGRGSLMKAILEGRVSSTDAGNAENALLRGAIGAGRSQLAGQCQCRLAGLEEHEVAEAAAHAKSEDLAVKRNRAIEVVRTKHHKGQGCIAHWIASEVVLVS
jgi:hypothetical protein